MQGRKESGGVGLEKKEGGRIHGPVGVECWEKGRGWIEVGEWGTGNKRLT